MKAKTFGMFSDYAAATAPYSSMKPDLSALPVSMSKVVDD